MSKSIPKLSDIHTIVFDFDGVFTDNKVWVDQNGNESVCCDRGDGLAFDLMRSFKRKYQLDINFLIVSKEKNSVVSIRAKKLNLECKQGIDNKLDFINKYLQKKFPNTSNPLNGLIALGNDLNDLQLMKEAAYSVSPSDAHPMIKDIADLILPQKGGEGFVRAFIEELIDFEKLSEDDINELIFDS